MKLMCKKEAEHRFYGPRKYRHETEREASNPVLGLLSLLDGRIYRFDDLLRPNPRRRLWLLGSARGCDIQLDDKYVSRGHCVMHRDGRTRRVSIADAGSKNGIYVNSMKIHAAELEPGDVLILGKTHFYVFGAAHISVIMGLKQRPQGVKTRKEHGGIRRAVRKVAKKFIRLRDRHRVSSHT